MHGRRNDENLGESSLVGAIGLSFLLGKKTSSRDFDAQVIQVGTNDWAKIASGHTVAGSSCTPDKADDATSCYAMVEVEDE